jgi:hypothetical protein
MPDDLQDLIDRLMASASKLDQEAAAALEAAQAERAELNEYRKRELYQLMSDISEDCYCASWLIGNERHLWRAITDPNDDHRYGMGEISEEDIARLRLLSQQVNGWWVWEDDGPDFISLDEWKRRLAALAAQKQEE